MGNILTISLSYKFYVETKKNKPHKYKNSKKNKSYLELIPKKNKLGMINDYFL